MSKLESLEVRRNKIFLGQVLNDIEFQADKQKIIHYIQQRSRNNADAKDKMLILQNVEIYNIRMSLK